jgi:predicted XRE-type DNA-binding protein
MTTDTAENETSAEETRMREELAEAIYELIKNSPWRQAAAGAVIALNRRSISESGLALQVSAKPVVEGSWK